MFRTDYRRIDTYRMINVREADGKIELLDGFDILFGKRLSGVAGPFDKLRTGKDILFLWEIPD